MTTKPRETGTFEHLSLDAIRQGGKVALARALSAIEARDGDGAVARLLDEATQQALDLRPDLGACGRDHRAAGRGQVHPGQRAHQALARAR